MNARTALYRHYNTTGELLYVGISASALARLAQHNHHSGWVSESVRMETEYFSDRMSALIAEKRAIIIEKPKFNIKHAYEKAVTDDNFAYPNASYSLTLIEIRLILVAITKMDFEERPVNPEITVSTYNFKEAGFNCNNIYNDLNSAVNRLRKQTIRLDDTEINWISAIDYQPGEGKVIIQFTTGIIPYLTQLTREFTRYKLNNVTQFKSTYSIRLYELLVQWLTIGKRDIEVEWLKKQLQVETNYPRVTDFKKWVIDAGVKEINKHSNIWVKYSQRKAGRIITHFLFTFGEKEAAKPKPAAETKRLVPLFTGHKDAPKVDNDAHFADLEKRYGKKANPNK